MWLAFAPCCSVRQVVEACAEDIGLKDRKKRLLDSIAELQKNNRKYRRRVREGRAHKAKASHFPLGPMTESEMKIIYRTKLVGPEGSSGRDVYERLKANAKRGRCPYCNCNQPETLDHYFPKTLFPMLAIDPWNLVPCCYQCNTAMLAGFAPNKTELFFHPYFESPQGKWLTVEVLEDGVPAAIYEADPQNTTDPVEAARICYQFDALRLDNVYATAVGGALADIRKQLRRLRDEIDHHAVADHLNEYAESMEEHGPNEWRAVLFRALAKSQWYCTGGFDEWW